MISIKTPDEIELMKVAGKIVGDTHNYLIPYIKLLKFIQESELKKKLKKKLVSIVIIKLVMTF